MGGIFSMVQGFFKAYKGKQIGTIIVNGGSSSGGNFSNPGAISGEINAPITVVSF